MLNTRNGIKRNGVFNPRASTNWSKDESNFGFKMLEKMGWKKGQGLGKNNQGMEGNVKLRLKTDTRGIGFRGESSNDNWLENNLGFTEILSELSACNGMKATPIKSTTLEKISETSKNRIHYRKYVKAKDVSKYSEKDLVAILAGNAKKRERQTTRVNDMGEYFEKKVGKKREESDPVNRKSTNKSEMPDEEAPLKKTSKREGRNVWAETAEFPVERIETPIKKKLSKERRKKCRDVALDKNELNVVVSAEDESKVFGSNEDELKVFESAQGESKVFGSADDESKIVESTEAETLNKKKSSKKHRKKCRDVVLDEGELKVGSVEDGSKVGSADADESKVFGRAEDESNIVESAEASGTSSKKKSIKKGRKKCGDVVRGEDESKDGSAEDGSKVVGSAEDDKSKIDDKKERRKFRNVRSDGEILKTGDFEGGEMNGGEKSSKSKKKRRRIAGNVDGNDCADENAAASDVESLLHRTNAIVKNMQKRVFSEMGAMKGYEEINKNLDENVGNLCKKYKEKIRKKRRREREEEIAWDLPEDFNVIEIGPKENCSAPAPSAGFSEDFEIGEEIYNKDGRRLTRCEQIKIKAEIARKAMLKDSEMVEEAAEKRASHGFKGANMKMILGYGMWD